MMTVIFSAMFSLCAQEEDIVRVFNGFSSDWMPSGYRDVKVNPVVNGHLCEIQLHLRDFFELKDGQHKVYQWARELPVTTEPDPRYLFDDLSGQVLEEMMKLSEANWAATEDVLPSLQMYTGKYLEAEEAFRKVEADCLRLALTLTPSECVCRTYLAPSVVVIRTRSITSRAFSCISLQNVDTRRPKTWEHDQPRGKRTLPVAFVLLFLPPPPSLAGLKLLAEAEEQMQGAEVNSDEWRNSLLNEASARSKLGTAAEMQVQ